MMEKRSHSSTISSNGKNSRARTVRELSQRLEKMESQRMRGDRSAVVTTGVTALDTLLPDKGFRNGTFVEWLADSAATGVDLLAMLSLRSVWQAGGTIVVLDRERTFYPPAAIAWGISPQQMIVVRPKSATEELWALEQCLQSAGVAVTLCRLERATSRALRRLQLAAERGGGLGVLWRPLSARGQPAWSDVQLMVTALVSLSSNRRWRVELVRSRRGARDSSVILELDDATGLVSPPAELVPTKAAPKSATA